MAGLERIAVLGTGAMDPSLTLVFAAKGFGVRLWAGRAKALILEKSRANSNLLAEHGLGWPNLILTIHQYLLKHLNTPPEPAPLLKEKMARGELGFKTGQGFDFDMDA